jgi:hypothetical protein
VLDRGFHLLRLDPALHLALLQVTIVVLLLLPLPLPLLLLLLLLLLLFEVIVLAAVQDVRGCQQRPPWATARRSSERCRIVCRPATRRPAARIALRTRGGWHNSDCDLHSWHSARFAPHVLSSRSGGRRRIRT